MGDRKAHRIIIRPHRPLAWLVLAALLVQPGLVFAQDDAAAPLLKPGDRISLTVPGRPDLDQDFELDAGGFAEINPVGSVMLAGRTTEEAILLLKQRLRLFYPTLDALEITVGSDERIRIYLIGDVGQAGVLNFVTEPTVWQVLRASGGPFDNVNLREARVIRDKDGLPEVFPLDLSGVLDGARTVEFVFKNGDTLVLPSLKDGIPATEAGRGVKVFGSVGLPTIVPIDEGTPLLDVLMLAGATGETANQSKINWVHLEDDRYQAVEVDLESFLREGNPQGNPLVYPGDAVHVAFKKPGWVRQNVPFILGSLAAVATIFLAYDTVTRDR